MTPNEMREQKKAAIEVAAGKLGWEAEVEIDGYGFVAYLSALGASEQMVEGKLSAAERILSDLGVPGLYPADETYDLIPLGVKDEAAELDEFVEHDAGEEDDEDYEDTADAMCARCGECGISPSWVTELAASMPEPTEGEGWEVPMLHEDSEFGDGRYTSPKETWAAAQVSDTPQNEYEHVHGGPRLAQEDTMSEETKGYVKTASQIVAEDGFVVVVRPTKADRAKGFKVQKFASINISHATALRDEYGYSINIAARQ